MELRPTEFTDLCFYYIKNSSPAYAKGNLISFKEAVLVLNMINPELPFAFMKFLFKLDGSNDRNELSLREIINLLETIKGGKLGEMAQLLKDSVQYIYETANSNEVNLIYYV